MGYLNLEMVEEAQGELGAISPGLMASEEFLGLMATICLKSGNWEHLRTVSIILVSKWPGECMHWIWLGTATRHCLSIAEAERVLQRALQTLPSEPLVHFNLACYAAQTGDLKLARERLARAINLDLTLRLKALDEPDLEPLWDDLGKTSNPPDHD